MKKILSKLKSSGITPYIWAILAILPFYFIFQSSSTLEVIVGILLTVVFFITLQMAFISKRWPVYLWTIILICISMTMSLLFQYIYLAFFIAYYNGNIRNRIAFFTLYIIHLSVTAAAVSVIVIFDYEIFFQHLPFIIITCISVVLMPVNIYNRKKQEKLEQQLETANNKIAELVKQEERQRIARDLHDTLGQKLSLIGLKSDLARRVMYKNPEQARNELKDVQQTARTALNEVRTLVSQMRGIRLKEELVSVQEILQVAQVELIIVYDKKLVYVSLFLENIMSMCMKEAVNNVVKHSQAKTCWIKIEQTPKDITIIVKDDGIGIDAKHALGKGNGLVGIRERLEFVNGTLEIDSHVGTTITMKIPTIVT